MDWTEVSTTILGVKVNCRSVGAPLNNTVATTNVFHLITIETINKPGMLITPPFPTIICGAGVSERKITLTGAGLIGTITKPACNESSTELTVSFKPNAGGTAQEHLSYTGKKYDLEESTETGTDVTAILEKHMTLKFTKPLKLVCT